jgi:hypothetical protein
VPNYRGRNGEIDKELGTEGLELRVGDWMVDLSASDLRLLLLCAREGKSSASTFRLRSRQALRCGQTLAIRSLGVHGIPGPQMRGCQVPGHGLHFVSRHPLQFTDGGRKISLVGEAEAGSAGEQPCRGIAGCDSSIPMSNRERAYSLLPVPVNSIGRKDRHASENSGERRPPRNFSLTKQTVARF